MTFIALSLSLHSSRSSGLALPAQEEQRFWTSSLSPLLLYIYNCVHRGQCSFGLARWLRVSAPTVYRPLGPFIVPARMASQRESSLVSSTFLSSSALAPSSLDHDPFFSFVTTTRSVSPVPWARMRSSSASDDEDRIDRGRR